MNNFGKNLNRLGRMSAASQADQVIQRSCVGRIVSMLTFFFILLCIVIYAILFYTAYKTGLQAKIPEQFQQYLAGGIVCSFLFMIVLAGLTGNWLRRIIWRALLRRKQ
jgi:hypothetical protein